MKFPFSFKQIDAFPNVGNLRSLYNSPFIKKSYIMSMFKSYVEALEHFS